METTGGERMIPTVEAEGQDELFFEHVARYAFVAPLVVGRRVLDAGCGGGYGSYHLARSGAEHVLGIDRSSEAIDYSRRHFERQGLAYEERDVAATGLDDESFDLVVCFEVFEHLEDPTAFLREARRLLSPQGLLVLSTPNALTYLAGTPDGSNPFHVREYSAGELREMVEAVFPSLELYVQNPFAGLGFFSTGDPREDDPVDLRLIASREASIWGETIPRQVDVERSGFLLVVAAADPAALPHAGDRLFAMGNDLSQPVDLLRHRDLAFHDLDREYRRLRTEYDARTDWTRGLEMHLRKTQDELRRVSEEYGRLKAEYEARTGWTRSLEEEIERTRKELYRVSDAYDHLLEEVSLRTRSLEVELEEAREALRRASAPLTEK